MFNVRTIFLIVATLLLIAGGCSQERKKESGKDSDALFSEQCKLLSDARDSMALCSDSLVIAELHANVEDAMAAAAMKHAPEAHLEFSEGKNDTIMRLTDAYLREYKKALKRTLPKPVSPDSAVAVLPIKSENTGSSKGL